MAEIKVEDIKNKIIAVTDLLKHTREQRDVLLQENARLTESNQSLKSEKEQLLNAIQSLEGKLDKVQEMPVSENKNNNERTEIKSKIRELAAEIDKCIALLNHEK